MTTGDTQTAYINAEKGLNLLEDLILTLYCIGKLKQPSLMMGNNLKVSLISHPYINFSKRTNWEFEIDNSNNPIKDICLTISKFFDNVKRRNKWN